MIKGVNSVIDLLEQNRCPYWQIKAAPKDVVKTKDESTDSEESYTMLQSTPFLRNQLERLESGKYWIDFWEKPTSKNTRLGEWFIIEPKDNSNQSSIGNIQSPINIKEEIQLAVLEAHDKWEKEHQIESLKKELLQKQTETNELQKHIKEVEGERTGIQTVFMEKLTPYIGHIAAAFMPKLAGQPAVSGTGNENTTTIILEGEGDEITRLNDALNLWGETETNVEEIISLINKIATLAKKDTNKYQMAKTLLN